ncbi:hypothetical protein L1887_49883 [Cichorium endivia]|nr:hypothetical protein L1887_49883 [Cichorium endivia]
MRIWIDTVGCIETGHGTGPGWFVLAKVGRVARLSQIGDDGRRDPALLERLPVHAVEPRVLLHIVCSTAQIAQTSAAVGRQEARDEIARDRVEVIGEDQLASKDLFVDQDRVGVVEGRIAGEHLEEQHAERPPVDGSAVAAALDDLGRQILGRATQRPGAVFELLGKAKVGNLGVAVSVDEQILGLEIAIHHTVLVQVLDGEHDRRHVEARHIGGELSGASEVRKDLATDHVLHEHVAVLAVLERGDHVDQEGVLHLGEDAALAVDVRDLLEPHHIRLGQHLECKVGASVRYIPMLEPHQQYAPKRAGAERLDDVKV